MTILIETERLVLRAPAENDLDNLFILQTNPFVMKFIAGGVRTKEKVELGLKEAIIHHNKYGYSLGSIFLKNNQFIGRAGLIHHNYDDMSDIEIAYAFLPEAWGKGYATEIGNALIKYAFSKLKLKKIIAVVDPQNSFSKMVLMKLGMKLSKKDYFYPTWNCNVDYFEITNVNR